MAQRPLSQRRASRTNQRALGNRRNSASKPRTAGPAKRRAQAMMQGRSSAQQLQHQQDRNDTGLGPMHGIAQPPPFIDLSGDGNDSIGQPYSMTVDPIVGGNNPEFDMYPPPAINPVQPFGVRSGSLQQRREQSMLMGGRGVPQQIPQAGVGQAPPQAVDGGYGTRPLSAPQAPGVMPERSGGIPNLQDIGAGLTRPQFVPEDSDALASNASAAGRAEGNRIYGVDRRADAHSAVQRQIDERAARISEARGGRSGWDNANAGRVNADAPRPIGGVDESKTLSGYLQGSVLGGVLSPAYEVSQAQNDRESSMMALIESNRAGGRDAQNNALQNAGFPTIGGIGSEPIDIDAARQRRADYLNKDKYASRQGDLDGRRKMRTDRSAREAEGRFNRLEQRKLNQVPRPMSIQDELMQRGDTRSAAFIESRRMAANVDKRRMQLEEEGMDSVKAQAQAEAEYKRAQARNLDSETEMTEKNLKEYGTEIGRLKQDREAYAGNPSPEAARERKRIDKEIKKLEKQRDAANGGQDSGQTSNEIPSMEQTSSDINDTIDSDPGFSSRWSIPTLADGSADFDNLDPVDTIDAISDYEGDIPEEDLDQLVDLLRTDGLVSEGDFGGIATWHETEEKRKALYGSVVGVDRETAKQRLPAMKRFIESNESGARNSKPPVIDGYTIKVKRKGRSGPAYGPSYGVEQTGYNTYKWVEVGGPAKPRT